MDYFKVNYDKLKNMEVKDFYILIYVFIFICLYLLFLSCFLKVKVRASCYGIIEDGLLKVGVSPLFSEKIKNGHQLKFKDTVTNYEIVKFGEYEIVDNNIIEEVYLKVDANYYDNEIGEVEIYYDEVKLCKYILDLFK